MPKHPSHILELARKGAAHRFDEIQAELAALIRHFPNLAGRATARKGRQAGRVVQSEAPVRRRKRRRSRISAEARKAISDRMKKFWAARRKSK